MENKINIAELLKDCPKGTKLYSPLVGECTLVHILGELKKILISASDGTTLTFNNNGTYFQMDNSECLLFPSKDQRDWSKFQRPFKDGDIVATDIGMWIGIVKKPSGGDTYEVYVGINTYCTNSLKYGSLSFSRPATEEEKQKLFKAIKDNGYHWNPETKTLEKLPKFKVGNKIKYKDIILTIIDVQTNNYIVEDEPNNFGILMFSQQDKWELINEPKFKVGDRIKEKQSNIIGEIIDVQKNKYNVRIDDKGLYLYFREQDNWELVPYKFDVTILKPFDKVLTRANDNENWVCNLYSHHIKDYYVVLNAELAPQCIPYEGNEHLLNTNNNCDNYYKTW